ncbi:MAG: hypothetical protein WD010_10350 [Nitriliruptor sp.]|uniref:hypothetical protein n=1 Tax=Nitriliruptor sp. TaxID=2448056 RepID=UPI0034A0A495
MLIAGAIVSLLGAVVVGALGTRGGGSLAAALLGVALTCGIAGLAALVGAVRAELQGRPDPRRRIVGGLGLLLLAPVMLMLAAGAAGAG